MLVKKKVLRWLNKFKSGTKFKYIDNNIEFIVDDEEKPELRKNRSNSYIFCIHTTYNKFRDQKQIIWGNKYKNVNFEDIIRFL